MKIKFLKKTFMHSDLTKYVDRGSEKEELVVYEIDDVVVKVHEKYLSRILKVPNHIEILEREVKEVKEKKAKKEE